MRTCELMLSFIPFGWSLFLNISIWKINCYNSEGNHCKDKGITLKLETLYSW